MVFVFGIISLQALPSVLVSYREKGYLRRLSTTPVGALRVLEVQWLIYTGICILSAIVTAAVAKIAFSVSLPSQALGFVVILILTAASMLSLGTVIAAVAPQPRASQLIGALVFYPMMFFAGLWVPQQSMGHTLQTISHATPLGSATYAVTQTMAGHWPPGWAFLVPVIWALLAARLAVRLFRWDK
jgi:ABC-2 type transport system permease protein